MPRSGNHGLLEFTGVRTNNRWTSKNVTWVGSKGATFEERAREWLCWLADSELEKAMAGSEALMLADPNNVDESLPCCENGATWFALATAEANRRWRGTGDFARVPSNPTPYG